MHHILIILAFLSIQSCQNAHSLLKTAKSIMQERPDSALALIKTIDTTDLTTSRLKADYSLYTVMAKDKNYITITDTTAIQPAIDYYSHHGNARTQSLVKYYTGIIQYQAKNYEAAVVCLSDAFELAKKTNDIWLKGIICSALSWTHNKNHNNQEELKYSKLSYAFFCEYGDSLYIDSAVFNQAIALHNNERFAESDSLFSLIKPNSKYYHSSLVFRADNEIKRPDNNPYKARDLFELAMCNGQKLRSNEYYSYAYSLAKTGDYRSADSIINILGKLTPDAIAEWNLYLIRNLEKRQIEAFHHLQAYVFKQDSLVKARLDQSLYRAETQHSLLLTEKAHNEKNKISIILLFTILCFTSLLSSIIVISLKNRSHLQTELNTLLQKYTDSHKILTQLQTCKNNQINTYAALYHTHYSRIGKLYNKNLDLSFPIISADIMYYDDIKETLSLITKPAEFDRKLDADLDRIMQKLRTDYPYMDESDFRLLSFVIIGFNDRTISLILNENNGTVRSRKSRLKKKILSADTPNKALYEAFLQ